MATKDTEAKTTTIAPISWIKFLKLNWYFLSGQKNSLSFGQHF